MAPPWWVFHPSWNYSIDREALLNGWTNPNKLEDKAKAIIEEKTSNSQNCKISLEIENNVVCLEKKSRTQE